MDIGTFIANFFLKPDNWFYFYMVFIAAAGGGWKIIAKRFNLSPRITFRPDLKDKRIAQLEMSLIEEQSDKSNLQGLFDVTRSQWRDDKRRLERENENLCELLRNYKVPETLIRRARGTGPLDPSRLNPQQTDSGTSTTRKEKDEPN